MGQEGGGQGGSAVRHGGLSTTTPEGGTRPKARDGQVRTSTRRGVLLHDWRGSQSATHWPDPEEGHELTHRYYYSGAYVGRVLLSRASVGDGKEEERKKPLAALLAAEGQDWAWQLLRMQEEEGGLLSAPSLDSASLARALLEHKPAGEQPPFL